MRLVRIGEKHSRVADDIRAALTAIGKGDSVAGGIALLDVTPQDGADFIDAVLVMPHGVLLVMGIDLPGPALRLDAPLNGQWKADNWPLVGTGDATNPGSAALAAADRFARRLHAETHVPVPIAALLAVGPYVETVSTNDADRMSPVRVLHPSPATLRDTIAALTPAGGRVCSVEQARALLRIVSPDLPIQPDSALAKEGFVAGSSAAHAGHGALDVEHNAVTPPPALLPPPPTVSPSTSQSERSEVRVLPIAAVVLIVAGIIAAIVLAAGGAKGSPPDSGKPSSSPAPVVHAVGEVEFTEVAKTDDDRCIDHTFGDVQAALERFGCTDIRLGSYLTAKDGKPAAVSIAVLRFADRAQAEAFGKVADVPGSGAAADAATAAKKWPGAAPSFDNAAYDSFVRDDTVRLVRVAWLDQTSTPDDEALGQLAATAFEVPFPR